MVPIFSLKAEKSKLYVIEREPVTSGSINVNTARFSFSPDWDGLTRTAVFRAGAVSVSILLDERGECVIPWEVLEKPGIRLEAGVYGTDGGGEVVLPTIWAGLGTILGGVSPGENARPPTPELWAQMLEQKGDNLDYTLSGELGLFSGDKLLSSVPVQGGGEGGATDHRQLTHREDEDQHPISAIIHLEENLSKIPTAMTAEELRKILMS